MKDTTRPVSGIFTRYRMVVRTTIAATDHWAQTVADGVKHDTASSIYQPVQAIISMLVEEEFPQAGTLEERLPGLPALRAVLSSYPVIDAVYAGYDNGDFFLLRSLHTQEIRELFNAPENSVIVVESSSFEDRNRSTDLFFDDELKLVQRRNRGETLFDPRTREWYAKAKDNAGLSTINPYIFFSRTREVDITFAQKNHAGDAVVGVDITLGQIASLLAAYLPTKSSELVLFRLDGALVASSSEMTVEDGGGRRLREAREQSPIVCLGIQTYKEGRTGRKFSLNSEGGNGCCFSILSVFPEKCRAPCFWRFPGMRCWKTPPPLYAGLF